MRRKLFIVALLVITVLVLSARVLAGSNRYGVADRRQVTFYNPVRVGDALLPPGTYEVVHQMQGEDHIMVFRKLPAKAGVGNRVSCKLVPAPAPIRQTQVGLALNSANEYVLKRLAFQGDRAEHHF